MDPLDPLVTGKRLLLALGLWLLAATVIGTATVFAARGSGAAAIAAIVVAEIYTLLIIALTIVFRPRTARRWAWSVVAALTSVSPSPHAAVRTSWRRQFNRLLGRGPGRARSRS